GTPRAGDWASGAAHPTMKHVALAQGPYRERPVMRKVRYVTVGALALCVGLAALGVGIGWFGPRRAPAPRPFTGSAGIALVPIPAGEFWMGGEKPAEQQLEAFPFELYRKKPSDFSDEYPRHPVRISRPFYLGKYEVTVGQFRRFVRETGYKTEA